MIAALLAAALAFPPFYVGPQVPYYNTIHITEYAATRAEGRARCRDDLRYYPPGKADCRVEFDGPDSWIDASQPGWARQFGPEWAQ